MRHFIPLALFSLFLVACERTPEIHKITGRAQGTTYSVSYWSKDDASTQEALKSDIDAELTRIDILMSNYRPDSEIEKFNSTKVANTPLALPAEIIDVLAISAEVHTKSKGCYDPTIGPLFSVWGFKKDSLSIPSSEQIKEKLEAVGFTRTLNITGNMVTKYNSETTIGLSAIGQGYAVEKISDLLKAKGINNFLAEIGGEMLVSGTKPESKEWKVGVERPVPNSQKISEIITLTGAQPTAIMTSGTYRHYFDDNGKRYSHILDPRTGKPVEHDAVSVTVFLPNATYADAWSTALLCLGEKDGLEVAEKNNIPAIFYSITDDTLKRSESSAVQKQSNNWSISQ